VAFYGDANKDNGVMVIVGQAGGNEANTRTAGGITTITADLTKMATDFANRGDGSTVLAETSATFAHEGQHGIDQLAQGIPNSRNAEYNIEMNAFAAQGYVNLGLGVNSAYGIWTTQNGWSGQNVKSSAETATQAWCQAGGNCQ
jgi:hypothetical protein